MRLSSLGEIDGEMGFRSSEEFGVISIARRGQDVVRDDVADGSPGQDVHDVESHGVVGLEEAHVLLGARVSRLEMGQPVLLRHLLRHVLPLEVEEHEPPHEQRQPRAEADHHRGIQLRLDRETAASARRASGGGGRGRGGELGEGAKALEADGGGGEGGGGDHGGHF
ncbi:photosystem 1 subunit 5 [Senna tora]|uniref:Photosystem 1 subunit 5 n=1 Tax=Senna tora TaxID=362788 RepID=A0A834WQS7_9FABA|nr:photosystem 1 subunit 5 [Senna tora]